MRDWLYELAETSCSSFKVRRDQWLLKPAENDNYFGILLVETPSLSRLDKSQNGCLEEGSNDIKQNTMGKMKPSMCYLPALR